MDDIDRQIVALLRLLRGPHGGLGGRESVEHHPEVEAAYTVAGEASAIVHVPRDTPHLEETLERLRDHPGVTRTQTQIVLSTLFERPFRG